MSLATTAGGHQQLQRLVRLTSLKFPPVPVARKPLANESPGDDCAQGPGLVRQERFVGTDPFTARKSPILLHRFNAGSLGNQVACCVLGQAQALDRFGPQQGGRVWPLRG